MLLALENILSEKILLSIRYVHIESNTIYHILTICMVYDYCNGVCFCPPFYLAVDNIPTS